MEAVSTISASAEEGYGCEENETRKERGVHEARNRCGPRRFATVSPCKAKTLSLWPHPEGHTTIPLMAIHVLQRSQVIHATLEECWAFFSDPRNLERITPPSLDFVVLSDLPPRVHPGMMIEYRVRPLFGIPLTWLTEITHVDEPHYFVDEQRVGPYRIWHHEHSFKALGDGRVEVSDRVHYVLPFAPFSDVLHSMVVQPQLEKIFSFRELALRERFKSEVRPS